MKRVYQILFNRPLHYEDKTNETEKPDEESYYIIRNSGDTLIWEEGMIRGE